MGRHVSALAAALDRIGKRGPRAGRLSFTPHLPPQNLTARYGTSGILTCQSELCM